MCLITFAKKGSDKLSDSFLKSIEIGMTKNTGGTGFAFKTKTGAIYMDKGIKSFEYLLNSFKKLNIPHDTELLVHSRSNMINNQVFNTQPFELNPNLEEELNKDILVKTTVNPVMFTDGVIPNFKEFNEPESDSYNFANNFMRVPEVWDMFVNERPKFESYFGSILGTCKFAFMSQHRDVILKGSFINEGLYSFSNIYYNSIQSNFNFGPRAIVKEAKNAVNNSNVSLKVIHAKNSDEKAVEISSVEINKFNSHEFYLEAKQLLGYIISPTCVIQEGSRWHIKKADFVKNLFTLESATEKSLYAIGLQLESINKYFRLIPKKEYARKYNDYINMHMDFKVTRSSIKKLYSGLISHIGRKNKNPFMSFKHHDKKYNWYVQSVAMILNDYRHFFTDYEIDYVLDKTNTIVEKELVND